MIARVDRLPKPKPDIENLLASLRRRPASRVSMLEIKLDDEVQAALLGEPLAKWSREAPLDERNRAISQTVGLMYRLGYDAFRFRTGIPFDVVRDKAEDTAGTTRAQREWQNEHTGPIQTMADAEQYAWPELKDVDFGPVEETIKALPEGMACVGYCAGIFEWSTWLMGLEGFMVAIYECPELVKFVVDRVGTVIYQSFEVWCKTEGVPILWLGDDLGFKTATMISPQHLREFIFPWHKKCAQLAHRYNKPFILHCCGNTKSVMNDLVADVGIDAKHSFEDVIQPVEDFAREWGDRVAVVGGVDIDILGRRSEEEVARRTMTILESCAQRPGYIAGSGNSVPNYVPVENYLSMIETIHRFNGR